MNQELNETMRTIIKMSGAIENVTKAITSAETSLANGQTELADLEMQLERKKQELIQLLTQ